MKYEDILYQGLDDCSSQEKRNQMIDATIAFFLEMKAKIESGDPAQKEEAIQKTSEIQSLLMARRNALCEMTGLTPERLEYLSQHPMFSKQHEAVAEAKAKLQKALRPTRRRRRSKFKNNKA